MTVLRLPGPLADVRAFRADRLGALAAWSAQGDVVQRRVGPYRLVLLAHPDGVHELLSARRGLSKGPVLQAAKVVLGEGLLTSDGELHRRHRRLIAPVLSSRRVAAHHRVVSDAARRTVRDWADGEVVDVHGAMSRLTLIVAARALFDADVEGDEAAIGQSVSELLGLSHSLAVPFARTLVRLGIPPGNRLRRARGRLDETVDHLVRRRLARPATGEDVLSVLLEAGVDRDGVRDEVMTLLLAGHETTASALSWAWWLLAHEPRARERLEEEVDALGGRSPTAHDDLPWARSVVAESLRLYPPSWAMGRRATEPLTIAGVDVGPGALVVASQWVVHRDPRWWPDPLRFAPERWLSAHHPPRSAYFPFGGGPRSCVGESLAWLESTLALAAISARWRFAPIPGASWSPLPRMTLRPAPGAVMRVRRR